RGSIMPATSEIAGFDRASVGPVGDDLAVMLGDARLLTFAHGTLQPSTSAQLPPLYSASDRSFRVADIDADGRLEAVLGSSDNFAQNGQIFAVDLLTGAPEWSRSSAGAIALANLDADPALEIVLGAAPGRVLDGATGALDWEYPGGFGRSVAAGRFLAGGAPGFVAGAEFQQLTGYQAAPYS